MINFNYQGNAIMVHLSDRDSAQKSMNLILNKKGVMGYFILVAPGQVAE